MEEVFANLEIMNKTLKDSIQLDAPVEAAPAAA